MIIIDKKMMDEVSAQAKRSLRLRMNFNLHSDLSDKCQRLLNALEPGTIMPVHHHKVDEVFILLCGKIRVMIYDDKGVETNSCILSNEEGNYGVQIPANTWHSLEVLETNSIIFEVKEGPYISHEVGGILSEGPIPQ